MSGTSNALQVFLYQRMVGSAALAALVGTRVYDRPPAAALFPYVSFGPSVATPDDGDELPGGSEVVQIDVWSTAPDGQRECKAIAAALRKLLHRVSAPLAEGALASLEVVLVRVMPDPDGVTTHGVVQVEAWIEEATA